MERTDIVEKLTEVLQMAMGDSIDVNSITEESNLVTDLGLNSVGILYVVIAIEEFFGIRFDDVTFGDFHTVKDVIDYIEKKVD
ncbi:MAG: acyl carrier protein [Clostridia bacterium]|nr:acyl carrier protein [Clostridia bacterium]